MTRTFIIEERNENKDGITYELRNTNKLPYHDDRLTLVVKTGDDDLQWRVGATVVVEVK